MQIPRGIIFDPGGNRTYAVAALAVSWCVFAYSTLIGPLAILTFYVCWLPILVLQPFILVVGAARLLPILALPGLALLSTLWSDAPDTTLRAALQYGSTFLCGLLAARLVSMPTLAIGGLVGSFLILSYSFAAGSFKYDVVDGSYAFAGAFASKNQLGFFSSLGLICAVSTLFLFRERTAWRIVALVVGAMAIIGLGMSKSATSMLTMVCVLATLPVLRALFSLPPTQRRTALLAVLVLALGGLVAAWQMGAFQSVLDLFGKDATLTGRTYLWRRGVEIGGESPGLGIGYYAFWVHDRPAAEVLWDEFYIASRSGFHFHNAFVEAYVALGLLGVALMVSMVALLAGMSLRVLFNRHLVGSAMLSAMLALLFAVRTFVEVDFFTPYTISSFLVPLILLQMADQRRTERALRAEQLRSPEPARHTV